MLFCEQLFYGRSERGYAILGASPGAAALSPRVEALCGSVGTPGGMYGGEPFLMSVPEGKHVIMLCGRRGAPDSMGRATLFFHALVAERDDLAAAGADAFALFGQGAFAERMPSTDVVALGIDVRGSGDARSEGSGLVGAGANPVLPCVFRSEKPDADLVRSAVGDRALDLSWTTFAFQAMRGFDVQVLAPRVSVPRDVYEYDASGVLLRGADAAARSRPAETRGGEVRRAATPERPARSGAPKEGGSAMLRFSIVVNVVLFAAVGLLLATRGSPSASFEKIVVTNTVEKVVERRVEAQVSEAQSSEIGRAAVEHYRKDLKDAFPTVDRIADFDSAEDDLPKIDDIRADVKFQTQKEFLKRLRSYVNFVNKYILEEKSK